MARVALELDRLVIERAKPKMFVSDLRRVEGNRINYISNAKRNDVIVTHKEFIATVEGMDVEAPTTPQ